MFFGYFKKSTKNQPVVFGREININKKNQILSLKRGKVFTFDREAFKNYTRKHPIVIGYGAVAVIAIVMLVSSTTSKATLAYFYPSSCLGGWEYPANAEGEPSLSDDAKRSEYNEDNSARLRGSSEIYCGSFEGQIPETAQATNFKVAFHISIDDGSVEHTKEEAKKIIDGEDLDVDTSSTDEHSLDNIIENSESSDDVENISDPLDAQNDFSEQVEDNSSNEENISVDTQLDEQEQEQEQEPEPTEAPSSESVGIFRLFTQTVFAEDVIPSENVESTEDSDTEVQVDDSNENDSETISDQDSEVETEEVIEATDVITEISEGIDDSDTTPLQDVAEVEQVTPADAVLEAFYSLDGADWISFGYIRMNDWEEARYDIPLSEWNDLSIVQVKLEPLSSFDQSPVVYLDSVVIEVEYAGTEEDVLAQPDFKTDTILIDTVVEDIRVIKVLRDGVPMIWYTKLPPPPEMVEVIDIPEIISIEGEEVDADLNIENESIIAEEPTDDVPMSLPVIEPTVESLIIPDTNAENMDVIDGVTFLEKVRGVFGFDLALAEGESSGEGDSGSSDSSSGSESSGESNNTESTETSESEDTSTSEDGGDTSNIESAEDSVQSEAESIQENQVPDTNTEIIETEGETNDDVFEVLVPGSDGIIVDDVVRDNLTDLPDPDNLGLTTTEEIVPGVIEIYYSDEQIQIEISKNLEWNLIALGDAVDIATPIDISGGKIFWFSRDKTAINEYNTNSGGISSQTVNPEIQTDLKYIEPNGDVSEITIDPVDLEITTPLEEETGIQTSVVPDFESIQVVDEIKLAPDALSNPISTEDEIL